jgi:hypothetical protein
VQRQCAGDYLVGCHRLALMTACFDERVDILDVDVHELGSTREAVAGGAWCQVTFRLALVHI